MTAGILDGIRIIDLACGIAGAAAALQLSEAGAEVIRIERPQESETHKAPLFRVLNRGKRTVLLDPAEPEGRVQLDQLLARADVLIHELTPTTAAAWGLDDERLTRRYPMLVVASITGWPAKHRWADEAPRETLVLARLGLLAEQPGHRPGPVFVRLPFASWLACWFCAIAVMARLIARDRDGRGGVARTSLAQAALAPMTMHWSRAESPTPVFAKGLSKDIPIPLHQCADGRWIHVHYSPDKAPWMAAALAEMGDEAVARENAAWPPSHVAPNFGANKAIIGTRPAQDWVEHFWEHDVAAQIAVPFGEIYQDDQARQAGYIVEIDDPLLGKTLQPGPAYRVEPPAQVRGPWREPTSDIDALLSALPPREPTTQPKQQPSQPLPPLHGLKVLDLGAYLAGPFATMMLADLGAEVIKVEPPKGDAMRRLERIFAGTQRGKRGLALKLGVAETQPVLERLARWADVAHHNVRMPAARKLGIDYDALKAINPTIIFGHLSSYGPTGPRADWPGFDQLMQASCGWEVESGGEGNPPMWLRFGVGDHLAALASVYATLLALYRRHRTGEGQAVNSSLLGGMLLTCAEAVARPDGSVTEIEHLDRDQTGLTPEHRLYACRDGWIAVAALNDSERRAFHTLVGTAPSAFFTEQNAADAIAALVGAGVPSAPVLEDQTEPFLDSADHAAAGLHAHYRHSAYGNLQQIGEFWDFRDLPLTIRRPPPALGEHTAEVLQELGFGPAELARLSEREVINL